MNTATPSLPRLRHLPRLRATLATLLVMAGLARAQPAPTLTPPNLGATALKSPPLARKIVLIGGEKTGGAGEHDYPNGIPLIAAWLKASPAFNAADVLTYTGGWPGDAGALTGASTIVLYFDGLDPKNSPLGDPGRVAQLQKLVDAGVGLVALHRAAATPAGAAPLPARDWFGAGITAEAERPPAATTLQPATPAHPVSAGVSAVTYPDAFALTLDASPLPFTVVPLLRAAGEPAGSAGAVAAWAFERTSGGRSFAFTGAHSLAALEQPALRQLLVNAIAWTARLDVPPGGIAVPGPVVGKTVVNRPVDNRVTEMPWGQIRWFTSAELKNTRTLTTGLAIIRPGQANPPHFHPNCDEVLHVISGRIRHTMNEVSAEMNAGDSVSIPQGVRHNAINIGTEDAVLGISFSTAYREAVGYDTK